MLSYDVRCKVCIGTLSHRLGGVQIIFIQFFACDRQTSVSNYFQASVEFVDFVEL